MPLALALVDTANASAPDAAPFELLPVVEPLVVPLLLLLRAPEEGLRSDGRDITMAGNLPWKLSARLLTLVLEGRVGLSVYVIFVLALLARFVVYACVRPA